LAKDNHLEVMPLLQAYGQLFDQDWNIIDCFFL
jgi:hypothetical protein